MKLDDIALFKLMTRKMNWLSQRQQVLSQNVANADTPGYKAFDLEPMAFQGEMARAGAALRPAVTNSKHLTGTLDRGGSSRADDDGEQYELAPSGNAVVLEDQMMKVADTAMDHQLVSNLYRKHVAMIKTALGRGGNG